MALVLGDSFEQFAQQAPVCVMVRAALEHALSPQEIDGLFEQVAERQHTRTLLFSAVVGMYTAARGEDRGRPTLDQAEAVKVLQEKLGVVRAMFHGFDYAAYLSGTPAQRL